MDAHYLATVQIRRQLHRPGYSTFDVVDVEWTHAISPVLMSGLSGHGDAVRWAEDNGYVVDHVRSNIGSPWCGGGSWRRIYAPTTLAPRACALARLAKAALSVR